MTIFYFGAVDNDDGATKKFTKKSYNPKGIIFTAQNNVGSDSRCVTMYHTETPVIALYGVMVGGLFFGWVRFGKPTFVSTAEIV